MLPLIPSVIQQCHHHHPISQDPMKILEMHTYRSRTGSTLMHETRTYDRPDESEADEPRFLPISIPRTPDTLSCGFGCILLPLSSPLQVRFFMMSGLKTYHQRLNNQREDRRKLMWYRNRYPTATNPRSSPAAIGEGHIYGAVRRQHRGDY